MRRLQPTSRSNGVVSQVMLSTEKSASPALIHLSAADLGDGEGGGIMSTLREELRWLLSELCGDLRNIEADQGSCGESDDDAGRSARLG